MNFVTLILWIPVNGMMYFINDILSWKSERLSVGTFSFEVSFAMLIHSLWHVTYLYNHKGPQLADIAHFHVSKRLITATVSIPDGLDVIHLSLIVSLKTLRKEEKIRGH